MRHTTENQIREIREQTKEENLTLLYYDTIDSTNTRLKEMAEEGAADRTIVIAETQTKGRGRFDRNFYSPAQSGIYLSILLRNRSLLEASHYTIQAAIAVTRMIKKMADIETQIKWVNDVYIQGKKLCGILVETLWGLKEHSCDVIIGIGVNLNVESFPDELKDTAASLHLDQDQKPTCIACLIDEFFQVMQEDFKQVMEEYRAKSCILHKEITFLWKGKKMKGLVQDINEEGNLVVLIDGKTEILQSGEVTMHIE